MQIAEILQRNGMTAGTEFTDALTYLVAKFGLTKVIETGTFLGMGTTKAVLDGFDSHGIRPVVFVSIEKDDLNYTVAVKNNIGRPVTIFKGLSIPKKLLPKKDDIRFDSYPEWAIVDHMDADRAEKYFNETHGAKKDDLLTYAMILCEHTPQLVILDSAGHIGTIEFDYLLPMITETCYIALDDTNHVKHMKTVERILGDGRFTEIFSTDQKFGSRIFKYDPL